ncbi:AraC family transcriptional regulator [Mesorhizobium sp. M2A.F.Ca.ET.037.01.1.1]|nr:AraC family transcriptional regulator [Mesorhizobium sp. M2A.F.Ca.ET.037.01.1.1]RWB47206.1 MAG: AraC family transcriptional regulator [Mesorhizobium sp.]RWF34854.1 MAG: AraC family transcriptional regulator [Mesorhizobium sp.]TIV45363.1 MAG: AraC family transcriptional regulator [Mesorhizobium sp.]TIW02763.1 MAG: AraC family transcriptional regulator [Mesorhizobium sp.]
MDAPLDRIAGETGFGDLGRMRRAFMRSFGQPPQALRRAEGDQLGSFKVINIFHEGVGRRILP